LKSIKNSQLKCLKEDQLNLPQEHIHLFLLTATLLIELELLKRQREKRNLITLSMDLAQMLASATQGLTKRKLLKKGLLLAPTT
jgi:hypothetical protein